MSYWIITGYNTETEEYEQLYGTDNRTEVAAELDYFYESYSDGYMTDLRISYLDNAWDETVDACLEQLREQRS